MVRTNFKAFFLLFFSLILTGCNKNRNNPGWDYFPDMFYSTAYESFTKNPNFENGMTMRVPAEGTIPRGFVPFEYTIDPESRIRAGNELVNPVLSTTEALNYGKVVYNTFCEGCHGPGADGNGHLYNSGLYPLKPRSLVADNAINLRDGELYHSITIGFGSMGAHDSQIRSEDRWKLILYIRQLQGDEKKKTGTKQGEK